MHVYLKNGDSQRWLVIYLIDGHIPKVADLSCDDAKRISETLEPAIWFKVMVLESIHIDCLKRVVYWTNGMKNKDGIPVTNMIYGNDPSCYDFDDDIDELFKLANYLIEKNPLAELNEEARKEQAVEYERCVIRMLHCYILSKVILQPCDLECMKNTLVIQQKAITQLDDKALVHSRLAEHYLAQMRSIRELDILPVLEELLKGILITHEFLDVLYFGIKKVTPTLRVEVDRAQKKVDHLKQVLSVEKSCKHSYELDCARNERDRVHINLEQHLIAKEFIESYLAIYKKYCGNAVDMNENCSKYLKLHKRVMHEKSISKATIDKKLLAVSVRECMELVIKDLKMGLESSGNDLAVDGKRSTDVMIGDQCAPEWQTLTQRLSSIVYNREHPVGMAFLSFCENLELTYRKLLRSVEDITHGSASVMTTFDDFYVISEIDVGINKLYLENQRNSISGHLYQITELLSELFKNNWFMFMRKVRLCYEKFFFNRVGRDLVLIYRLVYNQYMRNLEERIEKLKRVEICNLGLQMKSEWWLRLFEEESDVCDYHRDDCLDSEDLLGDEINGHDKDDLTDVEEDEFSDFKVVTDYCNNKSSSGLEMMFKLQSSKNKVLSRSCFDLCTSDGEENGKYLDEEIRKEMIDFTQDVFLYRDDTEIYRRKSSIQRSLTKRSNSISSFCCDKLQIGNCRKSRQSRDCFDEHFGPALKTIKNVFSNSSPLKKMQCLTHALKLISAKVEELRMRGRDEAHVDHAEIAVTAEDLLPLLVLVLLKLTPRDLSKLHVELLFVADFMAEFLSSGCHSYALCEFQIAFLVLDQTCEENFI